MKPLCWFSYLLAAISGISCVSPETPPVVPILVTVVDDTGAPVEGARVFIDGNPEGDTDAQGAREARVLGPEGRGVSVQVRCPDGYRPIETPPLRITCRFLHEMGSQKDRYIPLSARFTCGLAEQSWVLLVKTDGRDGLPVKALGDTVATTDRDGVAQVLLTGAPGEEMDVVIDTSEHPDLRPENPSRRVRVPAKKQILIFEQTFKQDRPNPKSRRRLGRRLGPRRI